MIDKNHNTSDYYFTYEHLTEYITICRVNEQHLSLLLAVIFSGNFDTNFEYEFPRPGKNPFKFSDNELIFVKNFIDNKGFHFPSSRLIYTDFSNTNTNFRFIIKHGSHLILITSSNEYYVNEFSLTIFNKPINHIDDNIFAFFQSSLDLIYQFQNTIDEKHFESLDTTNKIFTENTQNFTETIFKINKVIRNYRKMFKFNYKKLFYFSKNSNINDKTIKIIDEILSLFDDYIVSTEEILEISMDTINFSLSRDGHITNKTLKNISLITFIVLPLALELSYFGSNFNPLPLTNGPYAYLFFLIFALIQTVIISFFFYKRSNRGDL